MKHWNEGRKITLPFEDWPVAAQKEWERGFPRTSFAKQQAPDPKATIISDRYLGNILQAMERFRFFQNISNPDAQGLPLAQLFTRQDVRNFVADLKLGAIVVTDDDLEPTTIESYLDRLLAAARRLDPRGNYKWLERLARKNRPERQPPAPPPFDLEQMLEIGFDAMNEARDAIEDAKARRRGRGTHLCVLFRDGLLLVFLALIGLRIGESLTLAEGISLLLNDDDDELIYTIDLAAAVTKTRKAKVRDAPTQINDLISFYRAHVRPNFLGAAETKKFWMGTTGPLGYQGAYAALTRLTLRRAQKQANANDVRHAIMDESRKRGDSKEESGELMGHVCLETGGRFYTALKIVSNIAWLAARNGI